MEQRSVEKTLSPGRGCGLRARRRLQPGELLYRAQPFAAIAASPQRGRLCERCLRRNEDLLRCSQCKIARYCGKRCQKEDWQDHKRECKCLKSIEPNIPPDSVRLVGRIVFKLLRESACPSEKLYTLADLQSNIEKLSEEMKEGLGHLAQTLQLYLKAEVQDASQLSPAIDIFQIFAKVSTCYLLLSAYFWSCCSSWNTFLLDSYCSCIPGQATVLLHSWRFSLTDFIKVTCNCFTISNGEMQDVGVGLYPSMSLLNHSCDPNCVIVFEGYQLLLHSVREIQIGEELTISYIESLMPSNERQKQLKRQYCFECDCLQCQTQNKDADMLAGEEQVWNESRDAVTKVKNLKSPEEWEQVLVTCQTLLNNNADRLPDTNIYQLKLLDCAMDACINLGLWEQALHYGNRTLEPYRFYYPSFHPLRAVQMMRVAKLQCSQDMFHQALETLKQAYNIMKVTHGMDHSLVQTLMELKEQCEAGMRAQ
ncbi:histone-lysine N-methyltransferase SMYD3 isoform X1 [Alligator mississippiensis]|uniref:histone-lysine N-methyltransferase SMYD3 isoform X1 n=2 Tax=Alligator mississippiensis TaxID=8496 RepID=UPI0028772DA3|nr:histone-lysine N-methyltransferase SMYD3 isoform X1 [Alligator mississippiensis]